MCAASERQMKLRIEGLYYKIIITIVPSYTRKISLVFVPVGIVAHAVHLQYRRQQTSDSRYSIVLW